MTGWDAISAIRSARLRVGEYLLHWARVDGAGVALVDLRLEPTQLGGAVLVLPQQVADIVAGAGVASLGDAGVGTFLKAVGEGDV